MNNTPPKALQTFMERYKIDHDEVWEVRAGGAWAVKHSALERVAAEQKIAFEPPTVIEGSGADKIVALLVTARQDSRVEWSIGEASPANNKNAYCYAMAEKRGKDRCILKLLNAHGTVYSDAEAEEFSQNEGKPAYLPAAASQDIYKKLQKEIQECVSREQLNIWMKANKGRIKVLKPDWQDHLRIQCEEMMLDLKQRDTA